MEALSILCVCEDLGKLSAGWGCGGGRGLLSQGSCRHGDWI